MTEQVNKLIAHIDQKIKEQEEIYHAFLGDNDEDKSPSQIAENKINKYQEIKQQLLWIKENR